MESKRPSYPYKRKTASFIYTYYGNQKNYTEANQVCVQKENGTLAIINNQTMLEYLGKNALGNRYTQYFRIGLSKQGGKFHWIDGKNYSQNLNIYSSSMEESKTSCISYAILVNEINYQLHDNNCSYPLTFICQTTIKEPTITPIKLNKTTEKPITKVQFSKTSLKPIISMELSKTPQKLITSMEPTKTNWKRTTTSLQHNSIYVYIGVGLFLLVILAFIAYITCRKQQKKRPKVTKAHFFSTEHDDGGKTNIESESFKFVSSYENYHENRNYVEKNVNDTVQEIYYFTIENTIPAVEKTDNITYATVNEKKMKKTPEACEFYTVDDQPNEGAKQMSQHQTQSSQDECGDTYDNIIVENPYNFLETR